MSPTPQDSGCSARISSSPAGRATTTQPAPAAGSSAPPVTPTGTSGGPTNGAPGAWMWATSSPRRRPGAPSPTRSPVPAWPPPSPGTFDPGLSRRLGYPNEPADPAAATNRNEGCTGDRQEHGGADVSRGNLSGAGGRSGRAHRRGRPARVRGALQPLSPPHGALPDAPHPAL